MPFENKFQYENSPTVALVYIHSPGDTAPIQIPDDKGVSKKNSSGLHPVILADCAAFLGDELLVIVNFNHLERQRSHRESQHGEQARIYFSHILII